MKKKKNNLERLYESMLLALMYMSDNNKKINELKCLTIIS